MKLKSNVFSYISIVALFVQLAIVVILTHYYAQEVEQLIQKKAQNFHLAAEREIAVSLGEYDIPSIEKRLNNIQEYFPVHKVNIFDTDEDLVFQTGSDIAPIESRVFEYEIKDPSREFQVVGYLIFSLDIKDHTKKQKHILLLGSLIVLVSTLLLFLFAQLLLNTKIKFGKKLAHSNKLATIGSTTATVAHELGNPLSILGGEVMIIKLLLKKNKIDIPQINRAIENHQFTMKRIVSIIDSLRSYSRYESNDANLTFSYNNLYEMLKRMSPHITKHTEIELSFSSSVIESGHTYELPGDEGKAYQVITNILMNAKDALGNKGYIKYSDMIINDSTLKISIRDNGSGIPDKIKDKIFEPFYTTKDKDQGTGIGLDVVKSTITKMGGKVYFETKENEGTTFYIELPIKNVKKD